MEINIVPKFIDEAATPIAKSVGNSLSGIWELALGNQINLWLKKQEFKHQINYEDFINRTKNEINLISEQNLIEPEMHILGPILEASKYAISSEELRKIFAKLIASSVNSETVDLLHPSFIEIVKQLSSSDALLLSLMEPKARYPIVAIQLSEEANSEKGFRLNYSIAFTTLYEHLLDVTNPEEFMKHTISIDNLIRLGLISVDYQNSIADEDIYSFIENHPAHLEAQKKLIEAQKDGAPFNTVKTIQGILKTTHLGKNFFEVCLV
ncbi:MAG: DUF4393 domain-containing protein [Solibacillus sp.]